jgi:hypothetical protein
MGLGLAIEEITCHFSIIRHLQDKRMGGVGSGVEMAKSS